MKYSIEFKYRFELLVPLTNNHGQAFPWSKIKRVGEVFLNRFGGCHCQPWAPFLGMWKYRGAVYKEEFMLFTVDAPRSDESLSWMLSYKERLKQQFSQVEIYLAVTELHWL